MIEAAIAAHLVAQARLTGAIRGSLIAERGEFREPGAVLAVSWVTARGVREQRLVFRSPLARVAGRPQDPCCDLASDVTAVTERRSRTP